MKTITSGTITSPKGFLAGAIRAGIKTSGQLDLGILYSEVSCVAAGLFTTNRIKAAPVTISTTGSSWAMAIGAVIFLAGLLGSWLRGRR